MGAYFHPTSPNISKLLTLTAAHSEYGQDKAFEPCREQSLGPNFVQGYI